MSFVPFEKTAEKCPTLGDWIYVYNFKNPESPHAMELKTGIAKRFKKQMDELMEQLTVELSMPSNLKNMKQMLILLVNVSNEKKKRNCLVN